MLQVHCLYISFHCPLYLPGSRFKGRHLISQHFGILVTPIQAPLKSHVSRLPYMFYLRLEESSAQDPGNATGPLGVSIGGETPLINLVLYWPTLKCASQDFSIVLDTKKSHFLSWKSNKRMKNLCFRPRSALLSLETWANASTRWICFPPTKSSLPSRIDL